MELATGDNLTVSLQISPTVSLLPHAIETVLQHAEVATAHHYEEWCCGLDGHCNYARVIEQ